MSDDELTRRCLLKRKRPTSRRCAVRTAQGSLYVPTELPCQWDMPCNSRPQDQRPNPVQEGFGNSPIPEIAQGLITFTSSQNMILLLCLHHCAFEFMSLLLLPSFFANRSTSIPLLSLSTDCSSPVKEGQGRQG